MEYIKLPKVHIAKRGFADIFESLRASALRETEIKKKHKKNKNVR